MDSRSYATHLRAFHYLGWGDLFNWSNGIELEAGH